MTAISSSPAIVFVSAIISDAARASFDSIEAAGEEKIVALDEGVEVFEGEALVA